jgi:hypothetical protein
MISDFNGNQVAPHTKYTLNYVDLPVQLLYSPSFRVGKPWIGGGLYTGVLLNGKSTTNLGSYPLSIGSATNNAFKRFDVGFTATAGILIENDIQLGVDFQQSFAGIYPGNSYPGSSTPKILNSIWGVFLGYTWNVRKKIH